MNELWVIISAALVFFMQAGFTALECGLVRSKNRANVTLKNGIDFCVSGLLFFVLGFGLMFGNSSGGLFGTSYFFEIPESKTSFFIFQLVFCSTAVTIASGAIAERMRFHSYVLLVGVVAILVYPVVGHWIWATDAQGAPAGWLISKGFMDFAGGTVVHSVGAWAALAGILVIGPRYKRYDPKHRARFENHNLPLVGLGIFILWFGWIGFNGGSTLEFGTLTSKVIVNTMLAGIAGALVIVFYQVVFREKVSVIESLNGVLAGLVSITAGCAWMEPLTSLVVGGIGGVVGLLGLYWLERLKIDDVVSAIPIHGLCGVWGTLAIAIFGDVSSFQGNSRWEQLLIQLLGVGSVFGWSFLVTYFSVRAINAISRMRVTIHEELTGLDMVEHGIVQAETKAHSAASEESGNHQSNMSRTPSEENTKANESSLSISNTSAPQSRQKIRETQVLFERTVITAILVAGAIVVGLFALSNRTIYTLIEKSGERILKAEVDLILKFRRAYSEKVVDRVKGLIKVSHDYKDHPRAIPLPATLTKEIGTIHKDDLHQETNLYSDYPFPWRKKENKELLSPERSKAIEQLRLNPDKPIIEFTQSHGKKIIRYSVADRMAPACIQCHNNHADSPKVDWKVGDVRGVLEVSFPYEVTEDEMFAVIKEPLLGVLGLVGLGFIVLFLILARFKKASIASQRSLRLVQDQQAKLRESEARFRSISDSATSAMVSVNSEGEVILWNRAAREISEFDESEVLEKSVIQLIPERLRDAYLKKFAEVKATGLDDSEATFEFPVLTKSGKEVITEVVISSWTQKKERFFTAMARDISEKKEQEKQLEAQNMQLIHSEKLASIGELAAGVGHEINNPLAIIMGYVERVRKELDKQAFKSDRVEKCLNAQEKSIQRISKIVNGLRMFARTNSDTLEEVNVHEVIQDTVQLVDSIYRKEGVVIAEVLEAKNPMIDGNLGQLQQVIMNLFSNAKDATQDKPERKIDLCTETGTDGQVILRVSDNGTGMPKEVMTRIFDAFYTTKEVGKGTGMGLGLSKRFVEEMNGTIAVESEEGKGTTFILTFPKSSSSATPVKIAEKSEPSEEVADQKLYEELSGRILIVDDEPDIRELLASHLEDTKLDISFVENGKKALDLMEKQAFEYLITDVQMPELSGYELIENLASRGLQKQLRIILVSGGVVTEETKDQFERVQSMVDVVLRKPFSKKNVLDAVAGSNEEQKRAA